MLLIKTAFILVLVGVSVMFLTVPAIICTILKLLGFRKTMTVWTSKIAQFWGFFIIWLTGSKVTVIGRENIPKTGGICLVSNHGSIFDIILNLAYVGRQFGFIAKKELLFLPFFNAWIAILGGLFIDRKNPRKGLKTINKGIKRLKAGGGILIFPEGTRSRGQGLLPFRPGSFKLATQSGVPVVPVAISNSYNLFEVNNRLNNVPLCIEFCKPVDTAAIPPENRKQFLADEVRDIISEALKRCPV